MPRRSSQTPDTGGIGWHFMAQFCGCHVRRKPTKAGSLCSNKLSPSMEERKFLQCWQKTGTVVIRHFNRGKEELLFELTNHHLQVDAHSKKRWCSCQTRSPSPSKNTGSIKNKRSSGESHKMLKSRKQNQHFSYNIST